MLAGGAVDRRTALSLAARGLLLMSAPAALAACGRTVPRFVDRIGYQIDASIGEGNVSLTELVPLLKARARATEMDPVLNQVAPGHMPALLREQTALGNYDPQTNERPPVNRLVVFTAVEPGALEPIAAQALARGVKIVPYPRPLRHQTAAIVFDTPGAAAALARQAAAWARERLGGQGRVLLALPSSECAGENALCAEGDAIEQAWRAALTREAPGLQVTTNDEAVGELGGAEELAPLVRRQRIDIVLAWSDEVATGLARALRRQPPAHAPAGGPFVGALGAPTVVSRTTLAELQRRGPLHVVVAARLSDLANAMVDLPHALLHGAPPRNTALAAWTLTPGSTALAAYSRDYALHPSSGTITYEAVPLNPSAFH
jgi:ABC-type sugar transport system substrate-binding protein